MSLVTLKEILMGTVSGGYAIGAFDTMNHLFTESILAAAEEMGTPVILMSVDFGFKEREHMDAYFRCIHEMIRSARVPIALLLDHGKSFESCMKAIHYGFSGVMFDGSLLPFERNIIQTQKIVEAAHACGVSVEAEIGHVAGLEGRDLNNPEGREADEDSFTKPEDAYTFIEETGVDALAIAFGTVHGVYRGAPRLDLHRLEQIRGKVDIPLVMHGGSGISASVFRDAVRCGINKVNIFTHMSHAAAQAVMSLVQENSSGRIHFMEMTAVAQEQIVAVVKEHIEIFGTKPVS